MKKLLVFLCAILLVFGVVEIAKATLIDRGGGLIYDDVLDITWLQDANYANTAGYDSDGHMNWYDAKSWIDNLEYYDSVRNVIWDDWRLPQALPINGSTYNYNWSFDGSTDWGYNISAPGSAYPGNTNNEMAFMYYNNLGNLGWYDTNGNHRLVYGLQNTGPFINLQSYDYWSGNNYKPNMDSAWDFNFGYGPQGADGKATNDGNNAWAVRDGDVGLTPVPEPTTMFLLGTGLIGLVGFRRKFKK